MINIRKNHSSSAVLLSKVRLASPEDLPVIILSFTDRQKLPFTSQRFPHSVELTLRALLLSGILSQHRHLHITENTDGLPVAFTLTEQKSNNTQLLLLAGVWPDYRGQGVFSHIVERMTEVRPGDIFRIQLHPSMVIAIRQLRKLGYVQKSYNYSSSEIIYSRPARKTFQYSTAMIHNDILT